MGRFDERGRCLSLDLTECCRKVSLELEMGKQLYMALEYVQKGDYFPQENVRPPVHNGSRSCHSFQLVLYVEAMMWVVATKPPTSTL